METPNSEGPLSGPAQPRSIEKKMASSWVDCWTVSCAESGLKILRKSSAMSSVSWTAMIAITVKRGGSRIGVVSETERELGQAAVEPQVFLLSQRGCINDLSWAVPT